MIPPDIEQFLKELEASYDEVFKVEYTSPCSSCNDGKPRLVHRSPVTAKLGTDLRVILSRYPSLKS